jgi:hypothetical protein
LCGVYPLDFHGHPFLFSKLTYDVKDSPPIIVLCRATPVLVVNHVTTAAANASDFTPIWSTHRSAIGEAKMQHVIVQRGTLATPMNLK